MTFCQNTCKFYHSFYHIMKFINNFPQVAWNIFPSWGSGKKQCCIRVWKQNKTKQRKAVQNEKICDFYRNTTQYHKFVSCLRLDLRLEDLLSKIRQFRAFRKSGRYFWKSTSQTHTFSLFIHWVFVRKLPSGEWCSTSMKTNQHWFRQCLEAVKQQAITRSKVDQNLWRHITSLDHNEIPTLPESHCFYVRYEANTTFHVIKLSQSSVLLSSYFSCEYGCEKLISRAPLPYWWTAWHEHYDKIQWEVFPHHWHFVGKYVGCV